MKKYRCIKQLTMEQYDADGYWQPCKQITIAPGAVFRVSDKPLMIAAPPAGSERRTLGGTDAGHPGRAF